MWVGSQWFAPETVSHIQSVIAAEPTISRRELSRRVCDHLNWRAPDGKPKDMACRKALVELDRRGVVQLPPARQVPNFTKGHRGKELQADPPEFEPVRCSLKDLGPVDLVPISSRYSKESATWKAMMEHFHYLGSGPLCGAQIRYLVRSESHEVLGGLSFSSATLRLSNRDEWIGWSEAARRENLRQVVCNSRFLIAPSVEVPNLASHVLGLAAKRLPEDWKKRYRYAPVLLETFVDGQRFEGTCYRASNWRHLGQTAGRRSAFPNGKASTGSKEVFVYPLQSDAREVLCKVAARPLALRGLVGGSDNWIEQEFGSVQVFDGRLRKRLFSVVEDFYAQPGKLVPQALGGDVAKVKGAYRLLSNERLDMQGLLHGHFEATVQRARDHKVVLAPQDTTFLNYTTHPQTQGLGPINTRSDKAIGLVVHDTMAFTTEGTPIGLLDVQCWARDPKEAGKRDKRKDLPIEEKESLKWLLSYRSVAEAQELCPETMFVSIGDRESDIHELFQEAHETEGGPQLLVRADRGRQRKVEPDEDEENYQYLWDKLSSVSLAGELDLVVPRRGSQPKRVAHLEIRHAKVTLKPPNKKKLKPIPIWAVYAKEVGAPATVAKPLEWLLLTTVEVSNFDDANERLDWYARRWGIEVYHRVLKSGCRIQDRQLKTTDRIENCLALDMVVAWRIHWMTFLGRETPDIACDVVFEEDEWKALHVVVHDELPPSKPPPLRDMIRMIAALGGFLGRKGDGEPGTTTIWRGLERLDGVVIGYRAATRLYRQRGDP